MSNITVEYKISKDMIVKLQSESMTKLFEEIHAVNDSLKPEPCGKCQSESRHIVRNAGGNSFYELECTNNQCRAKLSLGIENNESKKLYKKRSKTDKDGKVVKVDGKTVYLPDRGWQRWDADKGKLV